jgi:hypothetical protein
MKIRLQVQVLVLVLPLLLSIFSSIGNAYPKSRLEGLDSDFCKNMKIDYRKDIATCEAQSAAKVLRAKVGAHLTAEEIKGLGFYLSNAVDLGLVPDADSNTAYFYVRWLLNSKRERVGVTTIEGWYNTEMESAARFDVRYNLLGEAVKVVERPMN